MENLRGGKIDMSRLGINVLDNIPKGSLIVLLSPAVPSSDKWLMDSRLFSPPSLLATHNCPGLLECSTWTRSVLQPPKSGTLRSLCPGKIAITLVLEKLLGKPVSGGCCGFSTRRGALPYFPSIFPSPRSLPRCSLSAGSALLGTMSALCCPVVERIQAVAGNTAFIPWACLAWAGDHLLLLTNFQLHYLLTLACTFD